jgi:hypothetical protein
MRLTCTTTCTNKPTNSREQTRKLRLNSPNEIPNIWMWDFKRQTLTRMTSDPGRSRTTLDARRPTNHLRREEDWRNRSVLARGGRHGIGDAVGHAHTTVDRVTDDFTRSPLPADSRGRPGSYLAMFDLGDWLRLPAPSSRSFQSKPLLKTSFEEYNAEASRADEVAEALPRAFILGGVLLQAL